MEMLVCNTGRHNQRPWNILENPKKWEEHQLLDVSADPKVSLFLDAWRAVFEGSDHGPDSPGIPGASRTSCSRETGKARKSCKRLEQLKAPGAHGAGSWWGFVPCSITLLGILPWDAADPWICGALLRPGPVSRQGRVFLGMGIPGEFWISPGLDLPAWP